MLQSNIFPKYEKDQNKIIDGSVYSKFNKCEKCLNSNNKKCNNFYDKMKNVDDGIYQCPYGLSTIVYNDNIITSLLIIELINDKTKYNFKEELKTKTKFFLDDIEQIIKINIDRDMKLDTYKESVHDLRNIASYFNAMVDEYIEAQKDKSLSSIEKSFISLYELINFRLDILNGSVDLTNILEKEQKIHPLVVKLSYLLKYKAHQKGIDINIDHVQDNSFNITKSLYLALFILMENAVKYALPNSKIKINFIETKNITKISIVNISDKIIETDADLLLKKGVRGSNGIGVGSGIGLTMASELLEKMGSSLNIKLFSISDNQTKFITEIELNNEKNI